MGSLVDKDMEKVKIAGTAFSYSRVDWDKLDASEYTLVTLVIDQSGSVFDFTPEIEATVRSVVEACKKSPKAENLLFRVVLFNYDVSEFHGFKVISTCELDDYKTFVIPNGTTALYSATEDAILAQSDYSKDLVDEGYKVNGILAIITDGLNNESPNNPTRVKQAIQKVRMDETMSSLVIILIGVNPTNDSRMDQELQAFKDEAELTQYETMDKTDSKTFGKLADFISKSVSAQSQNINGSGPSQNLSLSI